MTTTTGNLSRSQLSVMGRLEARRFARHPMFLVGTGLAWGLTILMGVLEDEPFGDTLSTPVAAAFFIGLFSLVAAARLTRSTETAGETVTTAPGSEATRTAGLVVACLVPFLAGLVWLGILLAVVAWRGTWPQEWWFATMPDLQVWSILLALGPVACLGGGLLGVLTGRWLRFPGAPAVVVLVTVVVCMLALGLVETDAPMLRLVAPWAAFHSGTDVDGTAILFPGNAFFYLLYALCLCAAAALVAMWHDRTARTARLRNAIVVVSVVGLVMLGLAMTTGPTDEQVSEPVPSKVSA